MTRRTVLAGAALLGAGVGVDRALGGALSSPAGAGPPAATGPVAFHGAHQAGVVTPPQRYLHLAAFDVTAPSRSALRDLLRRWTAASAAMTAGESYAPSPGAPSTPPVDTGEAVGLPAARLTLTFGFGPSLFGYGGRDRYGLARLRPNALRVLPPFAGERLEASHSDGDMCVQACADDPQVAFHAIHVLFHLAGQDATMRWAQLGFRGAGGDSRTTPRNLLGFKDGTSNISSTDAAALEEFVWVAPGDGPAWMSGGTYMAARRIEIVLSAWDGMSLAEQQRAIGRYKSSGAPLGARREHDPLDLGARTGAGQPVIPRDAHVRMASAQDNGGQRILRRGYSYSGGATPGPLDRGGQQLDAGLFFIAFVRDPDRQFIPMQSRLATGDALTEFTVHTASALFACPPGAASGEHIGQALFA